MQVLGLEHVDLTVNDMARSRPFYSVVLEALGFRQFDHPAQHASWSNGKMSLTIRPASPELAGAQFDRYRVGLHHLAFKASSRSDVDVLHRTLVRANFAVLDPPTEYPEYGERYYAVFFSDPDGLKLELVHFPWGYWKRAQSEGEDTRPRLGASSAGRPTPIRPPVVDRQ